MQLPYLSSFLKSIEIKRIQGLIKLELPYLSSFRFILTFLYKPWKVLTYKCLRVIGNRLTPIFVVLYSHICRLLIAVIAVNKELQVSLTYKRIQRILKRYVIRLFILCKKYFSFCLNSVKGYASFRKLKPYDSIFRLKLIKSIQSFKGKMCVDCNEVLRSFRFLNILSV